MPQVRFREVPTIPNDVIEIEFRDDNSNPDRGMAQQFANYFSSEILPGPPTSFNNVAFVNNGEYTLLLPGSPIPSFSVNLQSSSVSVIGSVVTLTTSNIGTAFPSTTDFENFQSLHFLTTAPNLSWSNHTAFTPDSFAYQAKFTMISGGINDLFNPDDHVPLSLEFEDEANAFEFQKAFNGVELDLPDHFIAAYQPISGRVVPYRIIISSHEDATFDIARSGRQITFMKRSGAGNAVVSVYGTTGSGSIIQSDGVTLPFLSFGLNTNGLALPQQRGFTAATSHEGYTGAKIEARGKPLKETKRNQNGYVGALL